MRCAGLVRFSFYGFCSSCVCRENALKFTGRLQKLTLDTCSRTEGSFNKLICEAEMHKRHKCHIKCLGWCFLTHFVYICGISQNQCLCYLTAHVSKVWQVCLPCCILGGHLKGVEMSLIRQCCCSTALTLLCLGCSMADLPEVAESYWYVNETSLFLANCTTYRPL